MMKTRREVPLAILGLVLAPALAVGQELVGHVARPVVSPDGTRLAFIYAPDQDSVREVYTARLDGSGARPLTSDGRSKKAPMWSPDGSRIAYHADFDGDAEIFLVPAGGGDPVQVTDAPGISVEPAWSPEGTRIAFYSNRESENYQIFSMKADGSDVRRLHRSGGDDLYPRFAPDGRIAFTSNRERDDWHDVYLMGADGGRVQRLTSAPGIDWAPSWSPDGTRIAFLSNRHDPELDPAGDFGIYVMSSAGGQARLVTSLPGQELFPAWSPSGRALVLGVFPGQDDSAETPEGVYWLDLDEGGGLTRIRLRR